MICVWYIFISKTTIFSVFNFCNTLAIFVLTFTGLVIILFQILLLEHEITTDRRLFRRNFFLCQLQYTIPGYWSPDAIFFPIVTYGTQCHAIGHQVIYHVCHGYERAIFILRRLLPYTSSWFFKAFLGPEVQTESQQGCGLKHILTICLNQTAVHKFDIQLQPIFKHTKYFD